MSGDESSASVPQIFDTLNNSTWDVVINGTGLQESILALFLSRAGQQILHIDSRPYYGGCETALSLQEAEAWASKLISDILIVLREILRETARGACTDLNESIFSSAKIVSDKNSSENGGLSFSRAYSLALAPHIILNSTDLLKTLITSGVHEQLEFLPVGPWWKLRPSRPREAKPIESLLWGSPQTDESGEFVIEKVCMTREDLFINQYHDKISQLSLMKFIHFLTEYNSNEESQALVSSYKDGKFSDFLSDQFNMPIEAQLEIFALIFSGSTLDNITTKQSLQRILDYLQSWGRFGPKFSAITLKWGGISELCQLACRSSAVYGATYSLSRGLESVELYADPSNNSSGLNLQLVSGDNLKAKCLIGEYEFQGDVKGTSRFRVARRVDIVLGNMKKLFIKLSVDFPRSSCAPIYIQPGLIKVPDADAASQAELDRVPILMLVHSSSLGECPTNQIIVYTSVNIIHEAVEQYAEEFLKIAVEKVLTAYQAMPTESNALLDELQTQKQAHETEQMDKPPRILWTLSYVQSVPLESDAENSTNEAEAVRRIYIPPLQPDLVLDPRFLDKLLVRTWSRISRLLFSVPQQYPDPNLLQRSSPSTSSDSRSDVPGSAQTGPEMSG